MRDVREEAVVQRQDATVGVRGENPAVSVHVRSPLPDAHCDIL